MVRTGLVLIVLGSLSLVSGLIMIIVGLVTGSGILCLWGLGVLAFAFLAAIVIFFAAMISLVTEVWNE